MARARIVVSVAVSLTLAVAFLPSEAGAKPIKSKISATVFGVITNDATIKYALSGQVAAEGLTLGCMEDRRVTLVKVGPNKKSKRVSGPRLAFSGNSRS